MEQVDVTQQPVFYLFIAFTILLTLGYSWGRRGNKRIYLSAFNALVETLKPKDQNFTTIGGQTGYHANLIPKKNKIIRRVDATITLLPRQSWLYLPFSLLTFRYDRLFLLLLFGKQAMSVAEEGHLIEEKYSRFRGPKITNEDRLQKEELRWGDKKFLLYYESDEMKGELLKLRDLIGEPRYLRHVAVVPDQDQAFCFMIPKRGYVREVFPVIYGWLHRLLERKMAEKKAAGEAGKK